MHSEQEDGLASVEFCTKDLFLFSAELSSGTSGSEYSSSVVQTFEKLP